MDYNENLYHALGVDKNADKNEIKRNYRKLSKQHHPDMNGGGEDDEFKRISSAYEILSDESKRNDYDVNSPHGKNYNPNNQFRNIFGGGNFNPFGPDGPFGQGSPFGFNFSFGDIFNRREEFIEDLDVRHQINISLKDVYNNEPLNIKFSRNVSCDVCNFSGFDPDSESFECDACDGKGNDGFTRCKFCNGTGKIHNGTCKKCNGNKVINADEEISINGTFSIDKSFSKYIRGYGHHSRYYQNKVGSLVVLVNYVGDDRYMREGVNLICKLDLHYKRAIDGYEYEYEHLDGKKYILKLPPKTKDGDSLRMSGKGLMISDSMRGDLIIKINIIIDYSLEN